MTQLMASQGFGNYNMVSASQDNFEGHGNYATPNPNATPTLHVLKSNLTKPGALVALSYDETYNNVMISLDVKLLSLNCYFVLSSQK
jgi:hypothetical protein